MRGKIPQNYIAVDLETTGLNPKTDKIIEIGAIRVVNGEAAEQFHTMVNPRRALDERITELTGIVDEMVEDAPDIGDILGDFLDFCGLLPLLGHHVIFDYSFLKRAAVNNGKTFERDGIDTLKLCRSLMPEAERKSLEAACSYFAIEREGAHRALGDAMDAYRLFQKLIACGAKTQPELFVPKPLIYKARREQPASKKQKEDLRYLLKYHKIDIPVQFDYLSRNEISRMKDKIIAQYGRIGTRDSN
ncbi:MAG: 3'-5' exonuclease [Lachnospiraceae bacterium]|nr:3'-5' exonuclease [Lachnospiraceae bacterium]